MGIVYHSNYLIWMEVGRVELFRAAGLRYRDFEQETGLQLAVVEANCRYISPARYDDEVIVRAAMREANARLVVIGYEMRNADTGEALAEGFTKHIFLGKDGRPKKLPEAWRETFGI
jgi:acyl-CoA thioester hydrolase